MSTAVLEIRNLAKTYPSGVQALKNVSLKVQKGEFLVIIGLSGSGKTTLLRCMNHLLTPTAGQVLFNGQSLTHVDPRIAMIFQQFNLVGRHSALSNVLMGRLHATSTVKSLLGLFSPADRAAAQKYLQLVGIGDKAPVRAQSLSGGQQQRVAIARALCQNPELLLADEPVASLDPATCHVVMDYLRKVNRELGITVVCNLHFLSLVREYATRVLALREGQLVFEGSPQQIDQAWFKKIYGETARDVYVQ
jgi:phosphonate transport system ATP-binding protein